MGAVSQVIEVMRQYGAAATFGAVARELRSRMPKPPGRQSAPAMPLPPDPSRDNSDSEVLANGARFHVRPNSSDHGIIGETWQAYILPLSAAGIDVFDDVVDLGAHIGGFSVQLATARQVRGSILALEPHPENFSLLTENIRSNGVSELVKARHAAVSTMNGTVRLAPSTTNNTGGHHLTLGTHRQSIEVVSIDALDLVTRPGTVVKMDIEGWELPTLRRLHSKLGLVRAVVGELHSTRWAVPSDCITLLTGAGFKVKLSGDARIPSFLAIRP